MNKSDNRRYPRIPHVASQQIIRLDNSQTPQKNIILMQNLSACGIKFTTHETLGPSTYFLIYLNNVLLKDIHESNQRFLRSGDYFMAKVVWAKKQKMNKYEIGAAFLEKQACQTTDIDTFTELVNISMLDMLPESSL